MWFMSWLYDEKLGFKCSDCGKRYKKAFNKKSVKNLIKNFPNTSDYCSGNTNKFILLLRKGVYPHEFMDSWKRFDKELLPDKEFCYRSSNMEDITDADYRHGKRVYKEFNLIINI